MSRTSQLRLGGRLRKVVLLLHIVAAGTWFGLDVAMAVLVYTAATSDSVAVQASALQTLEILTVWPMLGAASVSLGTGVLLGLGSKYGLLRYWWVAVKLGINVLFGLLIVTALRSGVTSAAEVGRNLVGGAQQVWDVTTMVYPPIVSPLGLALAFVLSVFKPWGRIRRRPTAES